MPNNPITNFDNPDSLLAMFEAKMDPLMLGPIPDRLEPTLSRIQEFEKHIGASLPDDYRLFLTKYAGVSVTATCPINEPSPCGDSTTIDVFYGFMPDKEYYGSLAENSDNSGGAPVVIPIAGGAFGSQIFLFLTGKSAGSVYSRDAQQRFFWPDAQFRSMFSNLSPKIAKYLELRKNNQLPQKQDGMENFYLIADSFTSFVDSMEYSD